MEIREKSATYRHGKVGSETDEDFRPIGERSEALSFFIARLRDVIGTGTIAEFARRCDVSHSNLSAILDGRSIPRWLTAMKIARAAGKPLDWFAPSDWTRSIEHMVDALEDVTAHVGRDLARRQTQPEDFCMVPLYDVRASAGHGAWNDSERVKKSLAFRRDWIASDLRVSPEQLMLVYVAGDSMEPTLSDGDVVMVDKSQRELASQPGVYVFLQEGALMIKRLQSMPGQRVLVISDNERFARYELSATDFEGDAARSTMIGRVVWSGVRL